MSVFETIIAPFIYLIQQLIILGYKLTGNYGVAIVLLSFAISLLLLPVFILIEKAKKKDDALKLKMKPFVDEIKRCYKGQERFYYLKTLNRQFYYSPTRALIPVLTLLLQIPFFIAAYQYLEAFEPLKGVSFLFIKDLSLPDGLFGAVNVLPIVMTLVNLITAYYYTRFSEGNERRQMLIVAGVFLVLLFNLPSGLVLYWTMNNVFSFLRLFITNKEVFRKQESDRQAKAVDFTALKQELRQLKVHLFRIAFALMVIGGYSQVSWALSNNFNGFIYRIIGVVVGCFFLAFIIGLLFIALKKNINRISQLTVKPLVLSALLFMATYFYISAKYYYSGLNMQLLIIAGLLTILAQFYGLVYWLKAWQTKKNTFFYLITSALSVLFLAQLVHLIALIGASPLLLTFLGLKLSALESSINLVVSGLLFAFISLPLFYKHHPIEYFEVNKRHFLLYLLALVYLLSLVFFWNPLIVFASYPDVFSFQAGSIVVNNLLVFVGVLFFFCLVYVLASLKVKNILLVAIPTLSILAFVNSFIIPLDLGALHTSKFSSEENLAAPILSYIIELVLILMAYAVVKWVLSKRKVMHLAFALALLTIVAIVQSVFLVQADEVNSTNIEQVEYEGGIPFSKTDSNVVVVLLDGFQGWFMNDILKESPELNKKMAGFTWYPNTLSISSMTYMSTAGIMCGFDYSVDKLNADTTRTNGEKVTIPCNLFIDKVKSEGYALNSTKMWHSKVKNTQFDNSIPDWHKNWNTVLNQESQKDMWYTRLWENALFGAMPLAIKPAIYNKQQWIIPKSDKGVSSEAKKYTFLKILPEISNTTGSTPNFIYIHNMASHSPWKIVDSSNAIIDDVGPFENNKWCILALADWFEWMKENGVYDNTKIILVSDHGPTWKKYDDGYTPVETPLKVDENDPNKIILNRFWRLNALLMVKDYGSVGNVKEDWRLMSNADIPAILFEESDPTKTLIENRVLPTAWAHWKKNILSDYEYNVYKYFEVRDNIFDLRNWKEVE